MGQYQHKNGGSFEAELNPKSVPFRVSLPPSKQITVEKGKILLIDGEKHIVQSIKKIEIGGGFIHIHGKATRQYKGWRGKNDI